MTRVLLILVLVVVIFHSASSAEEVVLRYNRWLPSGNFIDTKIFLPYFKQIEKVTLGRVKIVPTTSSLGPPTRQFDLARTGVADVVWGVEIYTPGRFPLTEITTLPFLSDDVEAANVAYWRVYKKYLEKFKEHKDVKVLTLCAFPPAHFYNSKKPIESLEDLKGMKLRAAGANVSEILGVLDAVPVPAPSSKLYELVSRGVVDGVIFTDASFVTRRLHEHLSYKTHVPGGLYLSSNFVVMNKSKWEGISLADQQAIMKISGEELARTFGRVQNEEIAKAQETMKSHGVKVNIPSQTFLKQLHEKLGFIEEAWLVKAKEKGLDGKPAVKMFRTEIASYKP
jgi:TRAP-type C4-dicarboxylate transport system substrate-binding protein